MMIYLKQAKQSFAEGENPFIFVRFEATTLADFMSQVAPYATDTSWEFATEEEWNAQQ